MLEAIAKARCLAGFFVVICWVAVELNLDSVPGQVIKDFSCAFFRKTLVNKTLALVLTTLVLAGCGGSFDPLPQTLSPVVQEALNKSYERYGQGPGAPWGFALCYSATGSDVKKVPDVARQTCGRGRLEYRGTDILFSDCPLLQPNRANFICYPADDAP